MTNDEMKRTIRKFLRLPPTSLPAAAEAAMETVIQHEDEAARVRDPNYIPTVEEALRNPAEFVEGMREG